MRDAVDANNANSNNNDKQESNGFADVHNNFTTTCKDIIQEQGAMA
jgi:hypothetical protein